MTDTLLSICIPTYNRPAELAECLQSLVTVSRTADLPPFEIVISDNASTLDVAGATAPFQDLLPIRYHLNPENVGPAANLILTSQRAKGEYLWFLADDDAIKARDFAALFSTMANKSACLYFIPRLICDRNLQELGLPTQPAIKDTDLHFADGKILFDQMAKEIGTVLGFFSSAIIRAADWHEALARHSQTFTEWHHLTTILQAIVDKPVILLAEPFILCRTDNYRSFKVNSKIWFDDYIRVFLFASTLGYTDAAMAANIGHIINKQQKTYFKDQALGIRRQSFRAVLVDLLGGTRFKDIPFRKTRWYYLSFLPQWILRPAFRMATLGRKFG